MKQIAIAFTLLALLTLVGSTPGSASALSDSADLRQIVHGELSFDHGELVEFVLSPGEARLSIGDQESGVYSLGVEATEGDRVWIRIDEMFDRTHDEVLASQSLELRLGAMVESSLAPVGVLLAVLGYALGTYAAWFCGQLMRIVAG